MDVELQGINYFLAMDIVIPYSMCQSVAMMVEIVAYRDLLSAQTVTIGKLSKMMWNYLEICLFVKIFNCGAA